MARRSEDHQIIAARRVDAVAQSGFPDDVVRIRRAEADRRETIDDLNIDAPGREVAIAVPHLVEECIGTRQKRCRVGELPGPQDAGGTRGRRSQQLEGYRVNR